ncbi:MAG: hypothetical protein IJL02_05485 [Methanobrevibacter sp.]|uniref:hypothetical protein n=1 Tax=Methanobrevibacter sp. TaxID=66852 RepID=UPI0025FE9A5A|nr:hypothetical protein [Methanobrevibacter sp.]MBQ6099299.1 hypothetical protein [Methanobrevibacter sp.]
MIFNKYISLALSALLFILMILIMASVSLVYKSASRYSAIGIVLFVVFYFISRAFYRYLRNDNQYKNNRQISSDRKGESYITKGESDSKKLFIVVWVVAVLVMICVALILFLVNNGLI